MQRLEKFLLLEESYDHEKSKEVEARFVSEGARMEPQHCGACLRRVWGPLWMPQMLL